VTEKAAYHNAVSDKLIVTFFTKHVVFQVFGKDHTKKYQEVQDNTDAIPTTFTEAIFSNTTLVCSGLPFTLVPLQDGEAELHYSLNHGAGQNVRIDETEDFGIAYQAPLAYLAASEKLVGVNTFTDIHLIYQYAAQKAHKHALYFYHLEGKVTILAWKQGVFTLANSYAAENTDELFYYVMLVVEQLELNTTELHLECIATKGKHEVYHALFKNFLPSLYLSPATYALGGQDAAHREWELMANYYAQCV
jgi:hypothetical protein